MEEDEHVVLEGDNYTDPITKVRTGVMTQTNQAMARFRLMRERGISLNGGLK